MKIKALLLSAVLFLLGAVTPAKAVDGCCAFSIGVTGAHVLSATVNGVDINTPGLWHSFWDGDQLNITMDNCVGGDYCPLGEPAVTMYSYKWNPSVHRMQIVGAQYITIHVGCAGGSYILHTSCEPAPDCSPWMSYSTVNTFCPCGANLCGE